MAYTPLDAGRLDKRVTIQVRADTDDGAGGSTIAWGTVATVWAGVATEGGREFMTAQQVTPSLTHLVTMRYRSGVKATANRILFGTRALAIEAVVNPAERNEQLVLHCAEVPK